MKETSTPSNEAVLSIQDLSEYLQTAKWEIRLWRLFRYGPKVHEGSTYRWGEVLAWLETCKEPPGYRPGLIEHAILSARNPGYLPALIERAITRARKH